MFDFLKKKVPSHKVILCVALPYDISSFHVCFSHGESDFLRSLGLSSLSEEKAWEKYSGIAGKISKCLSELKSRGVEILPFVNIESLDKVIGYDTVVLLAHHVENRDAIELLQSIVSTGTLVSLFPNLENAVIDITSCFSASFQLQLKHRCPTSRILAVNAKVSLELRLIMLQETIKRLSANYHKGYIDTLRDVCLDILKVQNNLDCNNDLIYLGGSGESLQSSVFAPVEAIPGSTFMVQLFIHKAKDSKTVQIKAEIVDETSGLRNNRNLSFELKEADKINVRLESLFDKNNDFEIDESDKSVEWNDEPVSLEYVVWVSEECKSKAFRGKLRIFVNSISAGDILFNVSIVNQPSHNPKTEFAAVSFSPYDRRKEFGDISQLLHDQLSKQLLDLESLKGSQKSFDVEVQIDITRHCIDLIGSDCKQTGSVKSVFISSTSDLKEYRDIVRSAAEKNHMYPEMYENWCQGNTYPRDKCCEKVLASDIFVCILSANYGCIEPIWGKSMTEIEYLVALQSGKPMLVYVDSQYLQKMSSIDDEQMKQRQLSLINEIKERRWIQFFDDPLSLELHVRTELAEIKKTL